MFETHETVTTGVRINHRKNPASRARLVSSDTNNRDVETSLGAKQDGYSRVPQYIALILGWGVLVVAYIIVLEKAVKEHDYFGVRGTQTRTRNFDVLAFFRTAFATIHVPVIISVLASTIPYWTMTNSKDNIDGNGAMLETSYDPIGELRSGSSVTQLFYLAGRTWAGLIGWATTCYDGFTLTRPSLPWIHLTIVVALAYIGFPLLSVAYVIESTSYWVPEQFQAAATLGGFNISLEQALNSMYDTNQWVYAGRFSAVSDSNLLENLTVFKSSQEIASLHQGLSDANSWAFGDDVLTLGVGVSSNSQLGLAAVQVNAVCTSAGYNDTVLAPRHSIGPEADLAFDFVDVSSDKSWPLPYRLSCKSACNNTLNSEAVSCFSNTSTLTMWPTDTTTSGYSCFTGQTLTCGSVKNDSSARLVATAQVQFAVNGPGTWTTVRTCELSVSYVRPIINTLIGEYIQATTEQSAASSLQVPGGLTPAQIVLLSIAGPMKIFHDGPPRLADDIGPVTDGFRWISWLSDDGKSAIAPNATRTFNFHYPGTSDQITPTATLLVTSSMPQGFISTYSRQGITLKTVSAGSNSSYPTADTLCPYFGGLTGNPWDLLQIRPKPPSGETYDIPFYDAYPHGNSLYRPNTIDEDIFLKPLASIISSPGFFANGTTTGVAFKTDLILVHGKVPPSFAIAVLMLPILWTLILSVVANSRKRWTASLDAFAMFRLGGDWRGNLKDMRLASLSQAKKELASIPGTVRVIPEQNSAQLVHLPGRVRSRYNEPSRQRRRTDTELPGSTVSLDR